MRRTNGVGKCIETREDDDLYLYDDVKNEFFIHATEGCYAVFFPNDAHRPGVCVGRQAARLPQGGRQGER